MTTEKLKPCPFCGGKPLVMSCDGLSRETKNKEYKKTVYWIAAAVLNAVVTI